MCELKPQATSLLTFEISLEQSVSSTTVQGHSHPGDSNNAN